MVSHFGWSNVKLAGDSVDIFDIMLQRPSRIAGVGLVILAAVKSG